MGIPGCAMSSGTSFDTFTLPRLPSVSAAVFPLLTDHNSYFSSTVTVAKIPSFRRVLNSINSQ